MPKPATDKTTWLRMRSTTDRNQTIGRAIELWIAINSIKDDPETWEGSAALGQICREWADRERERIRRPE